MKESLHLTCEDSARGIVKTQWGEEQRPGGGLVLVQCQRMALSQYIELEKGDLGKGLSPNNVLWDGRSRK